MVILILSMAPHCGPDSLLESGCSCPKSAEKFTALAEFVDPRAPSWPRSAGGRRLFLHRERGIGDASVRRRNAKSCTLARNFRNGQNIRARSRNRPGIGRWSTTCLVHPESDLCARRETNLQLHGAISIGDQCRFWTNLQDELGVRTGPVDHRRQEKENNYPHSAHVDLSASQQPSASAFF